MESASNASAAKSLFCAQCGTRLSPNARFCPNCGAPVRTASAVTAQTPAARMLNGREDFLTCDYYQLLGIGRGSGIRDIRAAVTSTRRQISQWPDSTDKECALERLKQAETTLTDDDARTRYALELQKKSSQAGPDVEHVTSGEQPSPRTSANPPAQAARSSQPQRQVQIQQVQASSASDDSGSFGWAVLGFFIPLVGLILWLVWKGDKPQTAKRCGYGALAGVLTNLFLYLVGGCSMAMLLA